MVITGPADELNRLQTGDNDTRKDRDQQRDVEHQSPERVGAEDDLVQFFARWRKDGWFVSRFVRHARRGVEFELFRTGTGIRELIFVNRVLVAIRICNNPAL